MERLVINIPEEKSKLVKQILKELGVTIQTENKSDTSNYKRKFTKVSVWSSEELQDIEEARKSFESLKTSKW